MIVICTINKLRALIKQKQLPKCYLDHIEEFFYALFDAYGAGVDIEEFSLNGTAEIVILDGSISELETCLPMVHGRLLDMSPEYVEKDDLVGLAVYKIALMLDNERMLFILSEVGQLDRSTEKWLEEQLEWTEMNLAAVPIGKIQELLQ